MSSIGTHDAITKTSPSSRVDVSVTAIDNMAQTFSYDAATVNSSSHEGVATSLDVVSSVTVSAATGLPLRTAVRAKFYTSYKGGETTTRVAERVWVFTYPPSKASAGELPAR